MSTLQFIDQQRGAHPAQQLCLPPGVVPSRYYAWRQAQAAGATQRAEPARETAMVIVFDDHKRRYGTRRLRAELRGLGHRVGRQALRTRLRRYGRQALQPRAFAPRTTDSTHGQRCPPNRRLDQPRSIQANQFWVSDITCRPLASCQRALRRLGSFTKMSVCKTIHPTGPIFSRRSRAQQVSSILD